MMQFKYEKDISNVDIEKLMLRYRTQLIKEKLKKVIKTQQEKKYEVMIKNKKKWMIRQNKINLGKK